ncbi:hypothetical protein LSCM4_00657 [Leishmania orientalis]|uniref:Uncharacterized protein n=1 Tax=Leishmania orientalis TaxID=2249476 RepID=A0A836G4H4_9TRYP|nr:hypothetical protein LSCM4_00657 [Leishmania orientalis]
MPPVSAPPAARPELAEPISFFESLQVLRSENPHYRAITHPSAEQIDNLNAVIRCLRLQLDGGAEESTGDETAYELAVALLWHSDTPLIEEGIQLMEYLLKERWEHYWATLVRNGPVAAVGIGKGEDDAAACSQLVESVPDEDGLDDGGIRDDARKGTSGSGAEWQCGNSSGAAGVAHLCSDGRTGNAMAESSANSRTPAILRGSAVQFATAPPPPEDECGSVPPSLVRDREQSLVLTPGAPGATVAASCSSAVSPASTTSTQCSKSSSSAPYTGAETASSSTKRHSPGPGDAQSHHERLANCFYNLAIGYTKLRNNDKALFYVSNMLRLRPQSEEGLLLRRLLCARLYIRHVFIFSVPLLAVGLIFL